MASHSDEQIKARSTSLLHTLKTLEQWLDDPNVNEIAVNRTGEVVLWKHGKWEHVDAPQITFEWLTKLGTQISAYAATEFSAEEPELSAYLPHGERIEMTMPPACANDRLLLNLRKHGAAAYPLQDYVDRKYFTKTKHITSFHLKPADRDHLSQFLSEEQMELWNLAGAGDWQAFLTKAVLYKMNIVIAGATGSGKTSFVRSLVEIIPGYERLLTVEDTPEMPLPNHPNSQALFYKKAGSPVGMSAKMSLMAVMRKTPDRVIQAELRGDETFYYIQGVLNSGHPGGLTTTHANSPNETFLRLALLIKASPEGSTLAFDEVMRMLYSLVHIVVQLKFDHELGRFCPAIYFDPMYTLHLMK